MANSTLLLRPSFDALKVKWHRLIVNVCDPYRPELHYMRDPGPKWRAKHQSSARRSQV
jgi:hypothetical protein